MKKTSSFFIALLFLSCTTLKHETVSKPQPGKNDPKELSTDDSKTRAISGKIDNSPKNVEITIREHVPYCGGAAPTHERQNLYNLVSDNFVIINIESGKKLVKMSESGILTLYLSPGKYKVIESYKDVPFNIFLRENDTNSHGKHTISLGPDCYKAWWEKPLIEFEVTENAELSKYNAHISARCFTGKNPCLYYNGPMPP